MTTALPHDDRPIDPTPVHTDELPATPVRDRRIPASAWIEAPDELHEIGVRAAALGATDADADADAESITDGDAPDTVVASFLRRIGPWLLWRAGPARGPAVYWAGHADDLHRTHTLVIDADGDHAGTGPSGEVHDRFRSWKEDLRDHP